MKYKNKKASRSAKIATGFFFQQSKNFTLTLSNSCKINTITELSWSNQLTQLTYVCGKYVSWLDIIAKPQGVLTHLLSEHGLKSKISKNMTQTVNPKIIPHEWVVSKTIHTNANESWSWYLWSVSYALNQTINTLRSMIIQHMEAAND